MYMPASQYAAAPVTTTTAAPVTYAAVPQANFVTEALPQMQMAQEVVDAVGLTAQFNVPAPVSLTQGMTTPDKLEAERVAYEKALAAQLKKQSDAALEEAKIKKQ